MRDSSRAKYRLLFPLFGLETLLIVVAEQPLNLTFYNFAFHDEGSNLTVHYLLSHGLRPTLDFGYPYGLFALIVNRLLPSGPYVFQFAMMVVAISISYALAVFAAALELKRSAIVLIVCAMPFAVMGLYWNYAHGLEAALLSNGIAQHARGRRGTALAFATAAVFAKPALGYVYGLILVIAILSDHRKRGLPAVAFLNEIAPAAITGIALTTILAFSFGLEPLMHTIIPWTGMAGYRYLHHGILRAGKSLWYYRGVSLGHYATSVSGFYLLGTAVLVLAGGVAMLRIVRGEPGGRSNEMVVTCAVLHAVFICALYGGVSSWEYYSYILLLGLAAAATLGTMLARVAWALAAIAVLGQKSTVSAIAYACRTTHRSPAISDLWVSPSEEDEWRQVRRLAAGRRSIVVSSAGAAFEFAPEVAPPVALYLMPGNSCPSEITRESAAIEQADLVIMPDYPGFVDWSLWFPEISAAVARLHIVWHGPHFEVLER